jgi:hypothetical protein
MVLILQLEDMDWLIELKIKIWLFPSLKKQTSPEKKQKSKMMENGILNKEIQKQERLATFNIWRSRLQDKITQKRQRRAINIDKNNNISIRYNNFKYICNECWSIQFHRKQTVPDIKGQIGPNTIMCDFNAPLLPRVRF